MKNSPIFFPKLRIERENKIHKKKRYKKNERLSQALRWKKSFHASSGKKCLKAAVLFIPKLSKILHIRSQTKKGNCTDKQASYNYLFSLFFQHSIPKEIYITQKNIV